MGLFPDGASTGMGGFGGANNKAISEEKKEVDSSGVSPLDSQKDLNIAEESPLKKTLNNFAETKSEESSSAFLKVDVDSKESSSIPVNKVRPEIKKDKDVSSSEKEPIKVVESNNVEYTLLAVDDDFKNQTSVKIAGLTVDEGMQFQSGFVVGSSDVFQLGENDNLLNAVAMSAEDKESLGDMSSYFFQTFSPDESVDNGITLNDLLTLCIDQDASDIHFSAEEKIALRINGKIHFIDNLGELSVKQARYLVFSLVPNPLHRKRLFDDKELDCAYEYKASGVNFRVNVYFKRGRVSAVLRKIASHAMTVEQLGLPEAVKNLLNQKQGLLLVTGPTGSGKSTSMQSMLEVINATRVEHILTIEDPVEYIFTNNKSIFSQREVGRDTDSFSNALRAALREDPDVVMIGEMRDTETIQAAMNLSETGHLVISTLHTSSAPQTIARIISYFPSAEQDQIQSRLADSLIGVLSQRLIPRTDREGRVAIFELMIVNSAIRNIIRTGDMTQIHNAMLAGREIGMVRMEDYARKLEEQGIINAKNFENFFREE